MRHAVIRVFGLVQGVSFRYFARQEAIRLKLTGSARNLEDGGVLIEAEGDPEKLEKFFDLCRRGPEAARVDKVEIVETEVKNLKDFRII